MIRILHQADAIPAQLVESLPCPADAYRSVTGGDSALLLSVTDSQPEQLLASPGYRNFVTHASTEIYHQQQFELRENTWAPKAPTSALIRWPARGQVRIIIQGSYRPNPKRQELTLREVMETRREPGCVAYDWYAHTRDVDKLLLLEVWQDQQLYDAHWLGRVETTAYRGDSGRTPAGDSEREFYRRAEFDLLYGRFLPQNPAHYSHTVVWPD